MAENGTKEGLVRTMLSLRPELAVVQRLHGVKVSRPRASGMFRMRYAKVVEAEKSIHV